MFFRSSKQSRIRKKKKISGKKRPVKSRKTKKEKISSVTRKNVCGNNISAGIKLQCPCHSRRSAGSKSGCKAGCTALVNSKRSCVQKRKLPLDAEDSKSDGSDGKDKFEEGICDDSRDYVNIESDTDN